MQPVDVMDSVQCFRDEVIENNPWQLSSVSRMEGVEELGLGLGLGLGRNVIF